MKYLALVKHPNGQGYVAAVETQDKSTGIVVVKGGKYGQSSYDQSVKNTGEFDARSHHEIWLEVVADSSK
jgi:hypothetical protein